MTGNLRRQIAAFTVAGLLLFAPVTPVFGQTPGATPQEATPGAAQTPPPGPAPSPAPTQAPTPPAQIPSPVPTQAPPPPQPVIPFHLSVGPDYSITAARPFFPHVLLPYRAMTMDSPQFNNSPRIEQLIQNGQLHITVQDAIELALENNTDISVQRYNSWIWETDLLRAKAGNIARGVAGLGNSNTNLPFANLPLVTYDPAFLATFSIDDRPFPVNNPLTAGTGTSTTNASLTQHFTIGNFSYLQGFKTGTTITMSLNSTRNSTTSSAVRFDPSIQTAANFAFTQQLLNGFGIYTNERYINVAKIGRKASDYFFMQAVLTDITTVENDYWELVFARNNVIVQQRAVDLAQRLYEDNQRQVEVGTLAPIEVVRARAQIATATQALVNAQTVQLQDQTLLMSVITKDPLAPAVRDVEIVPLDTVQTPPPIENIPIADAVKEALANRPDVLQASTNLQADDVNIKTARSALLPNLVLSGFVNSQGLSGNSLVTDANGNKVLVPNGWFDAAGQTFTGKFPEYEAQIALNIPIRNRSGQADAARALLVKRQDQERLQATYNSVAVDVRNAQIVLQQTRAEYAAAMTTRELQEQTLAADQTKFQVGAATLFEVVTDESNLEAAAGAEVRAQSDMAKAVVNFERAMGRTLQAHNVTIADAKSGSPARDTQIPGTTLSGEIITPKAAY